MPSDRVATAPPEGARVRFTAALEAVRRDLTGSKTLPAGTVGVMCGPWPYPVTDRKTNREGWLLVVVDDEEGAWHVPVEPRMVEEVVDQ